MLFIQLIALLGDMCCYHPLEFCDPRSHEVRKVPCGKCIGCLQDYQNSWKIRISDELKAAGYKGVYCTLTYDPACACAVDDAVDQESGEWFGSCDEYCKLTPFDVMHDRHRILSVNKKHCQSWIKRSRRRMEYDIGETKKFFYFLTSEYGPNTLRPHYHAIFIGLDVKDFEKYFLGDWAHQYILKYYKKSGSDRIFNGKRYFKSIKNVHYKGNVDYEQIVFDSGKSPDACADYVSKYCSKGFFENPRVSRGYVDKSFHLVSKGLGYSAVDSLRKHILQDYKECSVVVDNEDFSVCRDFYNGKNFAQDYYFGLLTNYNPKIHEKEPTYFKTSIRHSYDVDGNVIDSWYDDVFCLAPRLDFMRALVQRMHVVRYDSKQNKVYKYKLPRYYYDKIFPKDSAIRKAVADVLQLLSDEKLSRELGQLQTEWPFETPSQIYHRYLFQKANRDYRAESQAISYVRKRYGKSIL